MKFASLVGLFIIFALSTSCTKVVTETSPTIPESTYCTTNAVFGTSYTIDGTAYYKKRVLDVSGLGAIDPTNFPIRRAEVQVLNSSGTIVQCTETDANGDYTFTIPNDGKTYTVKVQSRSYNAFNKASVLNDPTSNSLHSISQSFVANATKSLPDMTAQADTSLDSSLRGGAFNILDQLFLANNFLLNNTAGAFTVTEKVQAYWSKGVNPVTYFGGDPSSGVSFYIPGTDKLYILGGIDGDVTVEDTDHYDNSVIVHEFGHFVEDNYSVSDSPGGSHYGLYTVDPRLAWSEGFSTFLASQVLGDPIYRDTVGIGTGYGFYYDAQNNDDINGNPMDMPTAGQLGEGGFRELAVVRSLWAATNTVLPFSELWGIYTDEFQNTDPFRELSLFLREQAAAIGATNISALYDDDDKELEATRLHYGTEDNSGTVDNAAAALCRWTMDSANQNPAFLGNTYDRSNQFYSNDFFYYSHPGGTLSVALAYDLAGATGTDLDLYVYQDDYTFGVGEDLLIYSNDSADGGTESVSITAPAGEYMINVMDYNAAAANPSTLYNLTIGTNIICR